MKRQEVLGRFVTSKAGHDKAGIYVIIEAEGDFVYLCDGRLKTLQKPKKKRLKHIQMTGTTVEQDLLNRLIEKNAVRDEEIKYAIKKYLKKDN